MSDFETGLCGCFDDCGVCILHYFAPCIAVAQVKAKVDERECFACDCCFWTPTLAWYIRQQIRAKYGYEFGACGDCCAIMFCNSLANCQHAREVNNKS